VAQAVEQWLSLLTDQFVYRSDPGFFGPLSKNQHAYSIIYDST